MRRLRSCSLAVLVALALAACRTAEVKPGSDTSTQAAPGAQPKRVKVGGKIQQAFSRAVQLARKGDLQGAERELEAVLAGEPTLDYAWTNLGVLYERGGRLKEAEAAYEHALGIRPEQPLAWDYLVRLYCRTRRAPEAEALARGHVAQHPSALGIRNALAFSLLAQGRREDAAGEAKKVLKADERNVRAMQLLAKAYYGEQKYELAQMVLENARTIDPEDAATHDELGLTQLKLKDRAGALESFKTATSLQPDDPEALNNYGALLNESQDYEGAARALEAAVYVAPDFADARLNLGNAYRGKQDFARALAEYQAVLKLEPARADAYYNLAILHLDSELPNQDPIDRLKASLAYFALYREKGGADAQVEEYVKDANKGIDREQRRRERERKEQLKRGRAVGVPPTAKDPAPSGKVSGEEK